MPAAPRASLAEVAVGQNHWRHQGPQVQDDAHLQTHTHSGLRHTHLVPGPVQGRNVFTEQVLLSTFAAYLSISNYRPQCMPSVSITVSRVRFATSAFTKYFWVQWKMPRESTRAQNEHDPRLRTYPAGGDLHPHGRLVRVQGQLRLGSATGQQRIRVVQTVRCCDRTYPTHAHCTHT